MKIVLALSELFSFFRSRLLLTTSLLVRIRLTTSRYFTQTCFSRIHTRWWCYTVIDIGGSCWSKIKRSNMYNFHEIELSFGGLSERDVLEKQI